MKNIDTFFATHFFFSFFHVGQDSVKLKRLCFKSFLLTVNRFIDSNIVRSKKLRIVTLA